MVKTRAVAKVLLLNADDEFLLLTRSESHPRLAGYYDLPGGIVEPHEDFCEGLIREIKEETGLELVLADLSVIYTTTKLISDKSFPTVLYYGKLKEADPEIVISWEHQRYEWAPLDRLGEVEPQLAPTYQEALDYVRQHDVIEALASI